MTWVSLFYFLLFCVCRFKQRKSELHDKLKETLIKGFLNSKLSRHNKNIFRWKAQLRRFCDSSHDQCSITTDFTCLEQKGQVAPGRYDELIDVFGNVDPRAVDIIRNTAAKFAEIEKEIQGIENLCELNNSVMIPKIIEILCLLNVEFKNIIIK